MTSTSKTTTIKGVNIDGDIVELEITNNSMKTTASNDVTNFNRPVNNPQEAVNNGDNARETRALNMNRISLETQLTAKISDEAASKLHNGNGDRPNLDNKEDWLNELWKLYISGALLDLKSVNSDTYAATSEFTGYMHNMDWQEKGDNESSVYDVTIKFVDEIRMSG